MSDADLYADLYALHWVFDARLQAELDRNIDPKQKLAELMKRHSADSPEGS